MNVTKKPNPGMSSSVAMENTIHDRTMRERMGVPIEVHETSGTVGAFIVRRRDGTLVTGKFVTIEASLIFSNVTNAAERLLVTRCSLFIVFPYAHFFALTASIPIDANDARKRFFGASDALSLILSFIMES